MFDFAQSGFSDIRMIAIFGKIRGGYPDFKFDGFLEPLVATRKKSTTSLSIKPPDGKNVLVHTNLVKGIHTMPEKSELS